jgi:hypothetical protein
MRSKLTIEVDFDNGKPYICVVMDRQSTDVRDKAIVAFRNKLGQLGINSEWCRVRFDDHAISGNQMFTIEPIQPHEMKDELELMKSALDRIEVVCEPVPA